MTYRSQYY